MKHNNILRLTPQIIAENELNSEYHKAFEKLINRTILVSIYRHDVIFKQHNIIDLIFSYEDIARFGKTPFTEHEYPLLSIAEDIPSFSNSFTIIKKTLYITDKKEYLRVLHQLRLEYNKNKNHKYINDTFKDVRHARGYLTYQSKFRDTISLKLIDSNEIRDYSRNIIVEIRKEEDSSKGIFYKLENPAYEIAPILYSRLAVRNKLGNKDDKLLKSIDEFLKDNERDIFEYTPVSRSYRIILNELKEWFSIDIFITRDKLIKGENSTRDFFIEVAEELKKFILKVKLFENVSKQEIFENFFLNDSSIKE